MTDAEELREISTKVRNMSKAEIQYNQYIQNAKVAAEAGETSIKLRTMKEVYFLDRLEHDALPLPPLTNKEEYAKSIYQEQLALVDLFRKNGFNVTETDPEVPNVFSIDITPEARAEIEREAAMVRRYIDKDIVISWE